MYETAKNFTHLQLSKLFSRHLSSFPQKGSRNFLTSCCIKYSHFLAGKSNKSRLSTFDTFCTFDIHRFFSYDSKEKLHQAYDTLPAFSRTRSDAASRLFSAPVGFQKRERKSCFFFGGEGKLRYVSEGERTHLTQMLGEKKRTRQREEQEKVRI